MNNQLIPVFSGSISNESALLCNARDLHVFLEVGRDFSNWIRERISEYGFTANLDYIVFSPKLAKTVGRRRKEYHLTLDTAKELAMVERNEKGRQIRRYFIECEKKLHQQPASQPAALEDEPMTITLTREELCSLCWIWNAAEYMRKNIELAYPAMRTLKSEYAPSFYSMAFEYQRTLEAGRKVLERETRAIVPHPHCVSDENWRRVLPKLRKTALPAQ